ncbi:ABC transporter [Macleaya cordata]|uniref:ABC transporter n=1 Tax=Macleaya cordata TaxID=56857 RepID=A0A200QWU5_MACCD|nr:ABC transporter [Macleaya cordata]
MDNCKNESESETPFANAGLLSRMWFWWLNPLLKKGRKKTLEDEDIPMLRKADGAETCYLSFMEQLMKQKGRTKSSSPPSIFWAIYFCYWKEILISGFFALLKVLTLSAGPLFLSAFIEVAEGKEAFKHEGYVLAMSLFLTKCLESLSQRHWFFHSRIMGVRIRSLLSAANYKKQLRLSNTAKAMHSAGEIMNYVTVDAYSVGEFPYVLHQTWTTSLQICLGLLILVRALGFSALAALTVIVLTVLCNSPLAKLQHKFQTKLMVAQDKRLKAISEALGNMKVLKLYAWETHFKTVIEGLRSEECKWLSAVQLRKGYNTFLFWASPIIVSIATFGTCYFLRVPLNASNVFTFVATLRIVQTPVRSIPEVIGVIIHAKVSLKRIANFLAAPELQSAGNVGQKIRNNEELKHAIYIKSANLSWEENQLKPTLTSINLEVKPGEKVAICGEVGAGKSTLLAAILGEVPKMKGTVQVYGKIAYVSQTAWIQSGSIQENILFGCTMDKQRYQETLEKCSLVKDLEMLPFGDLTEIGEKGINLSGGQKQRIQLARALYQDADIYLMDDPFSAVDAQTAASLFNEYVMGALSGKTVLLVTHQVDFLPAFHSVLLMSDGKILRAANYHMLLASSQEFHDLVNAHKETAGSERLSKVVSAPRRCGNSTTETGKSCYEDLFKESVGCQLIKQEERETGDTGLKPYLQYLNQNKGFFYLSLSSLAQLIFMAGQIFQNYWMAANVQNPQREYQTSSARLQTPARCDGDERWKRKTAAGVETARGGAALLL